MDVRIPAFSHRRILTGSAFQQLQRTLTDHNQGQAKEIHRAPRDTRQVTVHNAALRVLRCPCKEAECLTS